MFLFEEDAGDLTDFTIILPSVSVGNAGQLCVDVLLENIKAEKISSTQVLHPSLVPVVGPDPLGPPGNVATAFQMHIVRDEKLVIFQIRSGIIPGQGSAFISDFVEWFQMNKCRELLVVGSMHAHERIDKQISGTPLRYLSTRERSVPEDSVTLENRGSDEEAGLASAGPYIPGGGISSRMFNLCRDNNLAATLLLKFCSEGDNSVDGLVLAKYLNGFHKTVDQEVINKPKIPKSWRSLFGHSAPVQMFW